MADARELKRSSFSGTAVSHSCWPGFWSGLHTTGGGPAVGVAVGAGRRGADGVEEAPRAGFDQVDRLVGSARWHLEDRLAMQPLLPAVARALSLSRAR